MVQVHALIINKLCVRKYDSAFFLYTVLDTLLHQLVAFHLMKSFVWVFDMLLEVFRSSFSSRTSFFHIYLAY